MNQKYEDPLRPNIIIERKLWYKWQKSLKPSESMSGRIQKWIKTDLKRKGVRV